MKAAADYAIGGERKSAERPRPGASAPNPIRRDRQAGMSYMDIALKYRIDPRTAKRYAEKNLPLAHLENRPFASILDPYRALIDHWLQTERICATTVHGRLRAMGCLCSYGTVNGYVRKKLRG